MSFYALLSVAVLMHIATAEVYYVMPAANDSDFINETESRSSLEYYLKNTSKYFSSDSQFHFKMGHHYLNTDLVIQNTTNLTLTGEFEGLCIIRCTSHVGIIVFNVTDFSLENITFENCSSNYSNFLRNDHYASISKHKFSSNASLLLYRCMSVKINNIVILLSEGNTGMLVVNIQNYSKITNTCIIVQTICTLMSKSSLQTNGIMLYWNNSNKSEIQLNKFQFTTNGSCPHPIYCAIASLLFQNNRNVDVVIENTIFNDLINVTALYYYIETCRKSINRLTIKNCIMSNNIGNPNLKLFHVILYNVKCLSGLFALIRPYNFQQFTIVKFKFTKCNFKNNSNMTMIYISPASSQATTCYFYLIESSFHNNTNTHFLVMKSNSDNIWQFSNNAAIQKVNITSNVHDEGQDLMSFTNCRVWINGPITILSNGYYTNIFNLHLSIGTFHYDINITNNTVRQILSGKFVIIRRNTAMDISSNKVYILLNQVWTYSMSSESICKIQFYDDFDIFDISKFLTHMTVSNNVHMISTYLPNYDYKCRWLAGNAFQRARLLPKFVFGKLIQIENNTVISKDETRPIPMSICKCTRPSLCTDSTTIDHDCYSSHLGSIFPGQTIQVQLIVKKRWLRRNLSTVNIIVHITKGNYHDCSIVDTFQLSQTHFNHECNNYSYTLWPRNESVSLCRLFIGLRNMPEMFYVEFKPCPLGFTYQENRKSCYCDPVLNSNEVIFIKSCNLNDETILRPAYSWISAKRDNNTNNTTYIVSSYCPFKHCLPYQSNLDLSNPDSQCQFNRTGLLCGKCQQGLSTVFGSHKCKHCSNIYLLIIIPIAIAGVAFIMLLYIFNLTIKIGTVNTFIFYVNIININISMIFPDCQSFTCVTLAYMNFDFRTNSCFYNGMDDYAKAWLPLVFPLYLISIAIVFIILSRYSATVQRFTARKALPVLATLFLFSYTKILISVCNVLFQYSTVTHLPSNKMELVWTVSTTTPLFGLKFLALFIVCIILFLILLPFNLILLFTRALSCLRVITIFKPILDTYFGAYKDGAYYWTGLLLLIRAVVYALLAIDENLSFLIISILFGVLLCSHAAVQPYKSKFCNIQECIATLNLSAVHAVLLYKKNVVGQKIAMILISIGACYFIIAIVFHCCMYRWNNLIVKGIKWSFYMISKVKIIFKLPQENNITELNTLKSRIPDVAYPNFQEFQEPLLAIEPDK